MAQNNPGAGKHDADQIKSDAAAAAKGICPETGADLSGVNVESYVAHHFPQLGNVDPNSDYARRARLILDYGKKRDAKPAKVKDEVKP